ncbi:DUF3592 domain-containing protein [Amycolatopsis kentuckyensis]|uniref:DUF3592 domain-containing protein n=1 Tax=Amycolatopsis kentuckyensis TaxID=218823 RepID=UPI000A3CB213|nr:DUF3592 domain-containing protein [Amycolatopsis kentuckyensis]
MFAFALPDGPRPARRARLWLLGVPTTLAWAATGWSGTLGLLDGFRLMSLNRVDAWGVDAGPVVSLVLFFTVAVTVASSLGFAMLWATGISLHRTGFAVRAGSLATSLGVALGSGLAIPSWTPPESVGQRLPVSGGEAEPWSEVDWVVYYEPYLVPAVSALVALVLIALLLRGFLAEAEADDRAQALRHRGRQVTGVVTDVEFTDFRVTGHPRFVVHVRFPVDAGERTVVTTMVAPLYQAPARGSAVQVRYDPQDPEAVLVEPDPAGSPF